MKNLTNRKVKIMEPCKSASSGPGHFGLYPLLFLFLVCTLVACFEPREGCLEIEATNFDAAADKNCCCTYPSLKFTLTPMYDTLVWKPDTAYEYASGKWFRLKQAVFYLSDFQMFQGGAAIGIDDTVSLKTWGTNNDTLQTTFINDFEILRRTAVNYTVGTFRPSGSFESIRFRVGLPDDVQSVIPAAAPNGHPLQQQSEGLWLGRDTGYVAFKLVLTRDSFSSTSPDTLLFFRPDFNNVVIQQDGQFSHESGYDFNLKMTTDYRELFRNVDLSSGDISSWKAQIIANLPQVFSVSQ